MRKQEVGLTQRERIENKMEEYIYKSGVCSVNIIVPNRVVEVTFNDDLWTKTKVKTVCDKNDTFSLERALYIAYAKNDNIMTCIRQKVLRRKLMSLNMQNLMYPKSRML